jgi:hypothetical protein
VASTAVEGARDVVGEAKREVTDVARTATDEARRLFSEVSGEFRSQAGGQTDKLAEGLRTLSSQLQSAASGQPLDQGVVRDFASQAGSRVEQVAERLSSGGLEGVVDDVTRFARRRPGMFLASAAAAGFVAGRVLRGAQADAKASSGVRSTGSQSLPAAAPLPTPDVTAVRPAPVVPDPLVPEPTGVVVIDEGPTTGTPTVPPGVIPPGTDTLGGR